MGVEPDVGGVTATQVDAALLRFVMARGREAENCPSERCGGRAADLRRPCSGAR